MDPDERRTVISFYFGLNSVKNSMLLQKTQASRSNYVSSKSPSPEENSLYMSTQIWFKKQTD